MEGVAGKGNAAKVQRSAALVRFCLDRDRCDVAELAEGVEQGLLLEIREEAAEGWSDDGGPRAEAGENDGR